MSEQRQLALPSSSIGLQSFSISGPDGSAALVPAQAGPAPTVILAEANGTAVGGAAARSATSVGKFKIGIGIGFKHDQGTS